MEPKDDQDTDSFYAMDLELGRLKELRLRRDEAFYKKALEIEEDLDELWVLLGKFQWNYYKKPAVDTLVDAKNSHPEPIFSSVSKSHSSSKK
jgi:hypothetical protein